MTTAKSDFFEGVMGHESYQIRQRSCCLSVCGGMGVWGCGRVFFSHARGALNRCGIRDAGYRMQDVRESLLIPYPESRILYPQQIKRIWYNLIRMGQLSGIPYPASRIEHPVSEAFCVRAFNN